MRAIISQYHESASCTWCERETEGITVEFDDGFLQKGSLCWRCLQQATRVHHRQLGGTESTTIETPRKK